MNSPTPTPTLRSEEQPRRRSPRRALAATLTGVALAATMIAAAPTTAQATTIPPRCTVAQLRVRVDDRDPEGAAGTLLYRLTFTNLARSTCSLRGFPGVSLTDARGHQLGQPARWDRFPPVRRVTLTRGATAHSVLAMLQVGFYSARACRPATSSFVRVYPPGSFRSILIRFHARTCTAQTNTRVTPVTAGRGTP